MTSISVSKGWSQSLGHILVALIRFRYGWWRKFAKIGNIVVTVEQLTCYNLTVFPRL